jgi:hypothetical protein
MREDDATAYPMVDALLGPMADLRAEALHAVLGDGADQQHGDAQAGWAGADDRF